MICEACDGEGYVDVDGKRDKSKLRMPCAACGGFGVTYCCEGQEYIAKVFSSDSSWCKE